MNRITVAHPGRYGDLLWSLPTVRYLTELHGCPARVLLPTDPANTTPMGVLVPLLEQQPYIEEAVIVPEWSIVQDAPRMPKTPPGGPWGAECQYALGYEGWPTRPLPYEAAALAGEDALQAANRPGYFRPWITAPCGAIRPRTGEITVHWTDRYFELKLGILAEIERCLPGVYVHWLAQEGSRMCQAGARPTTFLQLAEICSMSKVVLTDCSAAHVLAAGCGVPHVLVVEPEEARHHFVFWPGSYTAEDGWHQHNSRLGRYILPVLGNDRRPTFDSRHTIDEIEKALAQ